MVSRHVLCTCLGDNRNPLISATNSSAFVLSTCLRNSCPRPTFALAPSISPGRSAKDICRWSGNVMTPIFGIMVVTEKKLPTLNYQLSTVHDKCRFEKSLMPVPIVQKRLVLSQSITCNTRDSFIPVLISF